MTTTKQDSTMDEAARAKALAKARTNATATLVIRHKDEYEALLAAEQADLGVTPKRARALTPEQKAEREAVRVAAVAERAEARRLAKVAALQEELRALLAADPDPLSVFSEPAIPAV